MVASVGAGEAVKIGLRSFRLSQPAVCMMPVVDGVYIWYSIRVLD